MQGYLTPELVELSPSEVKLCEAHADALERAGIRLSVFGATTVAINGLPARLKNPDASGLVRDVVAILANWGPCDGCPEDVDGDGAVTFLDLVAVLVNYGS